MPTVIRKADSTISYADRRRDLVQAVSWTVRSSAWSPPTDAYETDDAYIVRVELAGMRDSDFEITAESGYLQIRGNRPDFPERRAYQQMEIRFGKFSTVIGMPGPVDVDAAHAEYVDGFLTVTLPKVKPRFVEVDE
jgi:HSP20 family protein